MAKYHEVTIGQTEAVVNRMGGYEVWKKFAGGAGRIVFDLLSFRREITLAGRPAFTTTERSFKDAGVVWMGANFNTLFIGLTVVENPKTTFVVHNLEHSSPDSLIIADLGGEEKVETSVAHFLDLLSTNKGSKEFYIIYLRGKDGNLWAVRASWSVDDGGWNVDADSVSDLARWHTGHGVVSRK